MSSEPFPSVVTHPRATGSRAKLISWTAFDPKRAFPVGPGTDAERLRAAFPECLTERAPSARPRWGSSTMILPRGGFDRGGDHGSRRKPRCTPLASV
jgi:hypothetical protein